MNSAGRPPRGIPARDLVSLTAIALLLATIVMIAHPELPFVYNNLELHVAFATMAAFVLSVVALVLLGRYRRTRSARDLLALVAILVIMGKDLFLSALTAILSQDPDEQDTWAFHLVRVVGAGLLAAAAFMPEGPLRNPRRTQRIVGVSVAGALAVILGALYGLGSDLPGQFEDPPTDRESLERFGTQPVLTALESLAAGCYGAAAVGFARHADRYGDRFQMWLGLYSIVLGVAFVNYAIYPTLFTELVYVGDLLWLLAMSVLLYGTAREIAALQRAVAEAAVLDERRKFARDLHDGIAQELAFIASRIRWSRDQPPSEGEMTQIMESVERALDDARGSIAALKRPADEPLHVALARTAEDVASRLGGRIVLDLDEDARASGAWREALTRIVREAVANAIRHGHAHSVRLELRGGDSPLLRVSDDGDGFDPGVPHPHSFGLTSMRERTEALGGTFVLESAPGRGTSVEVLIP
jgi:signal transduction histidine kinase